MSILYPLFLLAGITIAVPVLIHLFNLRRYKTVNFPSIRFLKNIQLHSQKQSQLRYKWLLLTRVLFLLLLVLAFAQPFFNNRNLKKATGNLHVIYVDNSHSMSVKKGARTLLDIAREAARRQIMESPAGSEFIILTNDRPFSYQSISAEKALTALNETGFSPVTRPAAQIFATIQGITQSGGSNRGNIYYYSDFQQNSFPGTQDAALLRGFHFNGIPLRGSAVTNLFIDTAYLAVPALKTAQNNQLIVKTKSVGEPPKDPVIIQLTINGQVKNATGIEFTDGYEHVDTLAFQIDKTDWQRIELTVNDGSVHFDDTFRIAVRSAGNLSVLVLNEGQPNPYIQTAFRSYEGFQLTQRNITESADWSEFNLIILNGLTSIPGNLAKNIAVSLQRGQSVCFFPGKTSNTAGLSEGLQQIGDIRITGLDTVAQTAAHLQEGSDLVRDLFEKIPENVQLPVAGWHYNITAGLSANQQAILSFRNGDPMLSQYRPSRGYFYLLSTGTDIAAGNFTGSYFFVPFLYQMAAQSKGSDIYAVTAGKLQPVFLPVPHASDRNIIHAYAEGIDVIPPQRTSGSGLEVFLGKVLQQPGFYTLAGAQGDSTLVALNHNRAESELIYWDLDELRSGWKGEHISWNDYQTPSGKSSSGSALPLWKVCVILALLMLAAESYLLAGSYRKPSVASR